MTWAGSHSLEVVAKNCPEGLGTSKPLASGFDQCTRTPLLHLGWGLGSCEKKSDS